MLISTSDAVRAILKLDPTLDIQSRMRIVNAMLKAAKSHNAPPEPPLPVPRLIRRAEVAERLSVSTRTVDHLVADGALEKVYLPGRGRSRGFRDSDVNDLINNLPTHETEARKRTIVDREKHRALRKACVDMIEQYREITGVEIKGPLFDAMTQIAHHVGESLA
jgi:predicted DNA-binding transcriptional regulator AlpA